MIRSRKEREDIILSITKNCGKLNKQTHRKPQKTLDIKLTQSIKTFSFQPPISTEGSLTIGSTSLAVYNSSLNLTEEINEFDIYTFPDSKKVGITYVEVRDVIEKDLDVSDIRVNNLPDELTGPIYS